MIKFKNNKGKVIATITKPDFVAVVPVPESNTTYLRIQNSQIVIAIDYEVTGKIKVPSFFNRTYQIGKDGVVDFTFYITLNKLVRKNNE